MLAPCVTGRYAYATAMPATRTVQRDAVPILGLQDVTP
jgi:hypothetical protein